MGWSSSLLSLLLNGGFIASLGGFMMLLVSSLEVVVSGEDMIKMNIKKLLSCFH